MPPSDLMTVIAEQRRQNLRTLFQPAKISFKNRAIASEIAKFRYRLGQTGSTAQSQAGGGEREQRSFIEAATGSDMKELAMLLPGTTVSTLLADVAPILGVVRSGAFLIKRVNDLRVNIVAKVNANRALSHLDSGDALAAATAVQQMLNRVTTECVANLARTATQFAIGVGSIAADGGTAVNLAAALQRMVQSLIEIGLDISEYRAAKTCLQEAHFDQRLFKASPLLACYTLTCSNTSDIVALLADPSDQTHWMDQVEASKKQIDHLLGTCRKFIQSSRLEVTGIPCGIVQKAA